MLGRSFPAPAQVASPQSPNPMPQRAQGKVRFVLLAQGLEDLLHTAAVPAPQASAPCHWSPAISRSREIASKKTSRFVAVRRRVTTVPAPFRLSAHTPSHALSRNAGFFFFFLFPLALPLLLCASVGPPSVVVSARSSGCFARLGTGPDAAGSSVIWGVDALKAPRPLQAQLVGTHAHTLTHSRTRPLTLTRSHTLSLSFLLLTYSLTRLTRRKYPFASHLPSHYLVSSVTLPSSFPPRIAYRPAQLFPLLYLDFNLYLPVILLAGPFCHTSSHRHSSQTSAFGTLPRSQYTWVSTLDSRLLKHQPSAVALPSTSIRNRQSRSETALVTHRP
ncbi:hypothetical protein EDB81DRAFT_182107 [Dactylonectria macrodidyma]|uniref:Transmembrane protein n=1 Tax=Dactylonectria macrodidyma TaxID=307937 RepID=A0A9P9FQQ9_9HYPO|nr:hypothetical protein EDB81DRAFT_182107 [Dactylonectria macrodidyma]